MTFARGLRAILRQDPDVVMVGEIRDLETAEIAVQASLTGHLVLSTLHTNTAVGAVTRLRDMGIEPFLLSSSLVGVLAQRLVRVLDLEAREPYMASEYECRLLGVDPARPPTLYRARNDVAGIQRLQGPDGHLRTRNHRRRAAHHDPRRLRRARTRASCPHEGPEHSRLTGSRRCSPASPRWKRSCVSRGRTSAVQPERRCNRQLPMGAFEYTAVDPAGRETKGVIEGDTPRQVRQLLRERRLLPLSVTEVAEKEATRQQSFTLRRSMAPGDLSLVTRQLATLVQSALPLEEALLAVAEQTEQPRVKSILLGRSLQGHGRAHAGGWPGRFPESLP